MDSGEANNNFETDMFLIETIRDYPALWAKDRNFTRSENEQWMKISKEMGISSE